MKFLEFLYYESLPFLYTALGAFAVSQHNHSLIAATAGGILVLAGYLILERRYRYRAQRNPKKGLRLE